MREEEDIRFREENTDSSPDADLHDSYSVREEDAVRVALLMRMARFRHEVPCPDKDAEWETFKTGISGHVSGESRRMHPWVAALLGAAAMLLCVLGYDFLFKFYGERGVEDPVVMLNHDNSFRNVILQDGAVLYDVSSEDSLSFCAAKGRSVSKPKDVVEKSKGKEPALQSLSTPRGMDFKVILPDGSEVWLNAESTIDFPTAFTSTERHVILRGEAYFKVACDEHSPFIVSTEKMDVRVLGTEFNLRSYEEGSPHVSLVKGAVEVHAKNTEKTPVVTLKPGEGAWFDEHDGLHVAQEDMYAVTQWVNGFFYFDDCPLTDILRELGRWYNLGVIFQNTAAMHYKMHFSASRDGSVEEAVRNLNKLRKVRVVVEGVNLVAY